MGERIGVLGGSFDPIHYGHLILAEQIKTEAALDKIVFVPTYVSPFKIWNKPAESNHRLQMLKLAIGDYKSFEISTLELDKNEISYTYDTLAKIRNNYPKGTEIFFIVGTDAFMQIEDWNHSKELLTEFSFLIGLRKGYDETILESTINDLKNRYPLKARYIRIPELEIAASEVRASIAVGKSIKFLMPDTVIEYIEKHGLYVNMYKCLEEYVKSRVTQSRFDHTVGVVKMAKELAIQYGADPEKAEIAAWFHDVYRESGAIEHGPLAALEINKQFDIEDQEILDAIRYHTTGRAQMGLLEKIIYIADSLEPGRKFPGIEELRSLASRNIDECLYNLMVHTRDYVKSLDLSFDSSSIEAIEDLKHQIKKENSYE